MDPTEYQPESHVRRDIILMTVMCITLAIVLKTPAWNMPHHEPDEVGWWILAQRLVLDRGYNLLDAPILKMLAPGIYHDRPLFHHPPLFPVLLIPLCQAAG